MTFKALDLVASSEHVVALDIVLLEKGGILLCVDNVPSEFAADVEALDKAIKRVMDQAFSLVKKEKEEKEKVVDVKM